MDKFWEGDFTSVAASCDMQAKKGPLEWWWNHRGENLNFNHLQLDCSHKQLALHLMREISSYGFLFIHERTDQGQRKKRTSAISLLSCIDHGYMEVPSAKWDQIAHNGEVAVMEDEVD